MPIISLTPTEKTVHQHLLAAATQAIPTLAEALSAASILRKEATPHYSLLYLEPKPLPLSLPRVPLEVRFFGPWGAPIQCLLHVLDSALHMIEIFCADSAPLPDAITLQDIQIIDYTKEIQ